MANYSPVSSVAPTAEPIFYFLERKIKYPKVNKVGEAYTENCAGLRAFAAPECWYSFERQVGVEEKIRGH